MTGLSKVFVLPCAVFLQVWMSINSASAAKPCDMCIGKKMPAGYVDVVVEGDFTCKGYEWQALFIDESDEQCESYYQLIGHTKCGCPIDDETDSDQEKCDLCMDGSSPSKESEMIDIIHLGQWEAGGISCLEASGYLSSFSASPSTCSKFQELGVKNCGCQDASPSASPSYVDEKQPDCEALRQGIFPSIESQFIETTEFDYHLNLDLTEEVTVAEIALDLQKKISVIVSLEAVEGCSSSNDFIIRLDDVIIHYVKFIELVERADGELSDGLAKKSSGELFGFFVKIFYNKRFDSIYGLPIHCISGKIQVFHSVLPGNTRGGKAVDEESILNLVLKIINENLDSIAASVEGVEVVSGIEVVSDDDGASDGSGGDSTGVAIGVSIGSTFIILLLALLLRRKKKVKKELPNELDHVEFLPDEEFLPKVQVRSDQEGVELYPQDYNYPDDETTSTGYRDVKVFDSEGTEGAPPAFEAFPISSRTSRDPFRDSDSSDSDMPTDEENEARPIAFRKKASYRVKNTVEM